jgi:hypothetical protein
MNSAHLSAEQILQLLPKTQKQKVYDLQYEHLAEKDINERIKIRRLKTYNGDVVYDIRQYYREKPTKKGVRMNEDSLLALKAAIGEIID